MHQGEHSQGKLGAPKGHKKWWEVGQEHTK